MTTTQILANHSTFNSSPKNMQLPHSDDSYSTTNQIGDLQTLSMFISQQNTRASPLPKKSNKTPDQSHPDSQAVSTASTNENSKRSEPAPNPTTETSTHTKTKTITTRSGAKSDKANEDTQSEKSLQVAYATRSRKASEDTTTSNTRRQTRAAEQAIELEETKPQSENKKSNGDGSATQQGGGYHLRSAGQKSSNRESAFSDDFEYEYPGRNGHGSENSGNVTLSLRNRTNKGSTPTNEDNMSQQNGEGSSQKGGSGQKSGNSKKGKHLNMQNMICTEELTSFQFEAEIYEKKRSTERSIKFAMEMEENHLKCTGKTYQNKLWLIFL